MRSLNSKLIAGLILLVVNSAFAQGDAIPWAANLEQARSQAAQSGKLVLVHFWSTTCAPCLALDKYVFKNSDVGEAVAAKYIPVKVNVTERPDLARQFDVQRIPTDVILTGSGKELERRQSPGSVSGYIQMVNNAAQRANFGQNPNQQLAQHVREQNQRTSAEQFGVRQSQFQQPSSSNGFDTRSNGQSQTRGNTFDTGNGFDAQTPSARTAAKNPWEGYGSGGQANYGNAPPANTTRPTTNHPGFSNQPPSNTAQQNRSQIIYNNQYNNRNAPGDVRSSGPTTPSGGFGTSNTSPFAGGPSQPTQNPRASYPPAAQQNQFNQSPSFNPNPAPSTSVAPGRGPGGVTVIPPRRDPPRKPIAPKKPTLGLEGYCPVSLLESRDPRQAWRKGDPRFGAIHRGKLYLFAGQQLQQKFLASPDRYSPALSCYDPVRFVENSELIEGQRRHGVSYRGQVFLFSDEGSLKTFWQNPSRYSTIVRQAMNGQNGGGSIRR